MIQKQRLAAIKKSRFSIVPDFIADSVIKIDYHRLSSLGIKAIFIDLNGTVIDRRTQHISDRISAALAGSGMHIYITANRRRVRTLNKLIQDLGADGAVRPQYLYGKLTKRYYARGLRSYGLRPHEVVMIGDRFLAGILGANRTGMYSLLVHKLDAPAHAFDRLVSKAEKNLALKLSRSYKQYLID